MVASGSSAKGGRAVCHDAIAKAPGMDHSLGLELGRRVDIAPPRSHQFHRMLSHPQDQPARLDRSLRICCGHHHRGWMHENIRAARDALPALREAVVASRGFATWRSCVRSAPCHALADALSVLWLLTHDDLRCSIGATLDFGAKALASERPLLEGRRPNPSAIGSAVMKSAIGP